MDSLIKKLLLFIFLPLNIYAHPSEEAEENLLVIDTLTKYEFVTSALQFCTFFIENEKVSPTDKVHYLVKSSNLHLYVQDLEGYDRDIYFLKKLCENYSECSSEIFTYYEISFLNNNITS